MASTILARLACDEPTARRVATLVSESFEEAAGSAFEAEGGWIAEIYFSAPPDRDAVRATVAAASGDGAALSFIEVAEKDWIAASLSGLVPVHAGRFVVHGAHDRMRVPVNAIGIEIEAGLAFGTGHHGTTRGCLMALDALAKRRRPRNILDLGTGTGVLAIAAARLLHRRVLATDIDPMAVRCAHENYGRNRAGGMVETVHAAGFRGRVAINRVDLIFSNILLGPLLSMAAPLTRCLAPHGYLVLSGLVPAQANAVLAIYRGLGLTLMRRQILEGWVTLLLTRGPKSKPPRRRRRGGLR
jgi:ribosomal protein L11 methyltransferase